MRKRERAGKREMESPRRAWGGREEERDRGREEERERGREG